MNRLVAVVSYPAPASVYVSDISAPFDQTGLDCSLPTAAEDVRYGTAWNSTILDSSIATDIDAANVWTNLRCGCAG